MYVRTYICTSMYVCTRMYVSYVSMYVCIKYYVFMYVHMYVSCIYVYRDSRIILKWTLKKHVAWIHLTQAKDKRRAVVNKVMNFQVPRNVGNIL
jgi:hypothetical protein